MSQKAIVQNLHPFSNRTHSRSYTIFSNLRSVVDGFNYPNINGSIDRRSSNYFRLLYVICVSIFPLLLLAYVLYLVVTKITIFHLTRDTLIQNSMISNILKLLKNWLDGDIFGDIAIVII